LTTDFTDGLEDYKKTGETAKYAEYANLKSSQMDWKNKTIRAKPGRTGKAGIGWWGDSIEP